MASGEHGDGPSRARIELTDAPDEVDVDLLVGHVHAATVAATGRDDVRQLAALVRDEVDGSLVGGIVGSTWGGTCELEYLWVAPERRGHGLGRRLLVEAEGEARRRRCHQVVLFTHEIEAPGLYERLGYELIGRVDDYPAGGAAYWYRKPLGDDVAQSD